MYCVSSAVQCSAVESSTRLVFGNRVPIDVNHTEKEY